MYEKPCLPKLTQLKCRELIRSGEKRKMNGPGRYTLQQEENRHSGLSMRGYILF